MKEVVKGLIPIESFRSQFRSFGNEKDGIHWPSVAFVVGLPLAVAIASIVFRWDFLVGVEGALLAGVTLLGSVLIAVAAVVLQTIVSEAHRNDYATREDQKRVRSLEKIYGLIATGAFVSFVLVALLLWLDAIAADPMSGMAVAVHGLSAGVLVLAALMLLRVLTVMDAVATEYSHQANTREPSRN